MRTVVLLLFSVLTGFSVLAQGYLNFANGAAGVDAPIRDVDGTLLAGAGFRAILFFAPGSNQSEALLMPVNSLQSPFNVMFAGYFFGGSQVVPGTPAGGFITAQVRAWRLADGADWQTASASGGHAGKSNLINVRLGSATSPSVNLIGLASFNLVVPEPSAIALALLGGSLLLCRRRR